MKRSRAQRVMHGRTMVTSICILILVIAAAWQFSIAYCRTLLATYEKVTLSDRVEQVARLTADNIQPGEFGRLMTLVRVAPDPGDDAAEIRAVSAYHHLLCIASWFTSLFSSRAEQWCDAELARCAYFAAVTLDRRLVPAAE